MTSISDQLFRSLGTHALKELSMSSNSIALVVAPWSDLENEATAVFDDVQVEYFDTIFDSTADSTDLALPWDIIRFDVSDRGNDRWQFGLCCSDVHLGFSANAPKITFVKPSSHL
ncbi:hypothetical protein [Vibrio ulleungensis]|uniref:Uncharacterized protein n=1 Tax=Vibrio ulleungensis TaxID=2807619 RepID=A0ABS2HEI0_9VIBR|nr:hypothetical protein [Vibrio ulleungensis]MBM7035031.1 hypothetical protein [Vibrio ulleungensis]